MTDRQIGQSGADVDITAGQPRVGQTGASVDIVPVQPAQQTGALAVSVEYGYPLGVQSGQVGLSLDLFADGITRRLGSIGLMVDYVVSAVPTTAVRWSGTLFEMGTSSPVVRWAGSAFDTSGSAPIVIWQTDHFELAP